MALMRDISASQPRLMRLNDGGCLEECVMMPGIRHVDAAGISVEYDSGLQNIFKLIVSDSLF